MDGFGASGLVLKVQLVERLMDLDRMIAAERARTKPDEALIRRLAREKSLARDRMAALGGCGMPAWARGDGVAPG